MSLERSDTIFYDSSENLKFREALVDLTRSAYMAAHESDVQESSYTNTTGDLLVTDEAQINGQRREYSFYAENDDTSSIEIQSIAYTKIGDLTVDAVRLIYDEMSKSDDDDGIKRKVSYEPGEIGGAEVEQFMRRTFYVQLDTGDVRVASDMGYTVDSIEVDGPLEGRVSELDEARERIFERDDFIELIQALRTLGLVSHGQIQQFLKQF